MSNGLKLKPILAAIVAAGLLYGGYAYVYAAPKSRLLKDLAAQQNAVNGYETALKRRLEISSGLRTFADSTLGASKDEVESRFRTGLYSVATSCGLTGITTNTQEPTKEISPLSKAKLSSAYAGLKRELKNRVDFHTIPGAPRVFNGKVFVDPQAQKTDGKQTNKALLLSPHARVDTKPQLEIFADDVKCTHGATIGRMDDAALFYLKSRGIGAESAKALLTYAFAAEPLETIEIDALRLELERQVFARFTHSHLE